MPDEKEKVSVQTLLNKLKASKDPKEKRNLRAKLRAAGHTGGLGEPRKPPKPKGKRAFATA